MAASRASMHREPPEGKSQLESDSSGPGREERMSARSKPRERALRQRIAALVQDGGLPLIVQTEVTAGPGSGKQCLACGLPVIFTQAQYDAEYERDGVQHLNLHRACYVIWQTECRKQIAVRSRLASRETRPV